MQLNLIRIIANEYLTEIICWEIIHALFITLYTMYTESRINDIDYVYLYNVSLFVAHREMLFA